MGLINQLIKVPKKNIYIIIEINKKKKKCKNTNKGIIPIL